MYEDAGEIYKYLPIEAGTENRYIKHLFGAFQAINEKDEPIKAFSILPFHLLFMLAVQYKIYRISAWNHNDYLSYLANDKMYYKNEDKQILISNAPMPNSSGLIPSDSSVRNLSKIRETCLFSLFKIIGLDETIIKQATDLVRIRGTYAHANGNIEENIEIRIDEYFAILKEIQKHMPVVNNAMQNWVDEIEKNEFPLDDFFREKFLQSQFSQYDFGDVIDKLLESPKLDINQWNQFTDKGLELSYEQTIFALRKIAQNETSDNKRFNTIKILKDNHEIDNNLKKVILAKEKNIKIINLLNK